MKSLRFWLLSLAVVPVAQAGTPTPKPKSDEKSGWVFSLLPKSLQKNPNLDLTVITEMTPAGKKLPQASPQKPLYYIAQSMGFRALGDVTHGENNLAATEVERILERSLASGGYLPAKPPEHPPTIAILYVWGSHNLLTEADADDKSISSQKVMRNLLDRALLVGGDKFAKRLLELFAQADAQAGANVTPAPVDGVASEAVLGQAQLDFINPVTQFKRQDPKNEFLVDQAAADCFYVVASAYDYQPLTQNNKILLWRTRMTANSAGVSQEQSLPTLITSAAPFFGKEMDGPEIIVKHAVREGQVEAGTPTVVDPAPAAGKSSEKK